MQKNMNVRNTLLVIISIVIIFLTGCSDIESRAQEKNLCIATWNVRGYPETEQADRAWFHDQLIKMNPDIICIQEIANQEKVNSFLTNEISFTSVAFQDSSDGQDNAIFTTSKIEMKDISDPNGFQHPAQSAYVAYKGFDAVIVTVHLSWTNIELREKEKLLLKDLVKLMLTIDPDVIIVGDFNTQGQAIQELATSIGMTVMTPAGQDGVGTTHAGNRYDHFLISPDMANEEALNCRIHIFIGDDLVQAKRVSDHLPVIAFFKTDSQYRDRK
jgi:exonuclease III